MKFKPGDYILYEFSDGFSDGVLFGVVADPEKHYTPLGDLIKDDSGYLDGDYTFAFFEYTDEYKNDEFARCAPTKDCKLVTHMKSPLYKILTKDLE